MDRHTRRRREYVAGRLQLIEAMERNEETMRALETDLSRLVAEGRDGLTVTRCDRYRGNGRLVSL